MRTGCPTSYHWWARRKSRSVCSTSCQVTDSLRHFSVLLGSRLRLLALMRRVSLLARASALVRGAPSRLRASLADAPRVQVATAPRSALRPAGSLECAAACMSEVSGRRWASVEALRSEPSPSSPPPQPLAVEEPTALTPSKVVELLDRYIVGQARASQRLALKHSQCWVVSLPGRAPPLLSHPRRRLAVGG